MRESNFQSDSAWTRVAPLWIGWAGICTILIVVLSRVWDGFFIPWWFNTDEVVFFYEIVRRLRLEPTQTLFFVAGGTATLLFKLGVIQPGPLTHTMLLTTPARPEKYGGAKESVAKDPKWLLDNDAAEKLYFCMLVATGKFAQPPNEVGLQVRHLRTGRINRVFLRNHSSGFAGGKGLPANLNRTRMHLEQT